MAPIAEQSYVSHRCEPRRITGLPDPDPIAAAVVRDALAAVANQMRISIVRTAFSPIIYDINDCACAVYDRNLRQIGQAHEGLPSFAGVLGASIKACVEACGGEPNLAEGDILLTTASYHHGSHLNDFAVVAPTFVDGELVGYVASKAHMLDTGAKDPVAVLDSTDIFQEGLIIPGVKLFIAGEVNDGVMRIILANTRLPGPLQGDLNSMIGSMRVGVKAFQDVVARYGTAAFRACIELILDHAETRMRDYIETIPDGRYTGSGIFDGAPGEDPMDVEVVVEINGSDIVADVTGVPDQLNYPDNLPIANTISVLRAFLMCLLGSTEIVNEGYFRPLEVRTRPGTMFHPGPSAPVSVYVMSVSALEAFLNALSQAIPDRIPAQSGGDTETLGFAGFTDEGMFWVTISQRFGGQGGLPDRDGTCPIPFIPWSGMRSNSCEVYEARSPVIIDECEIVPDSAGLGKYRGYPGHRVRVRPRSPMGVLFLLDRAKVGAYGLLGGTRGLPNAGQLLPADGPATSYTKAGMVPAGPGDVIEVVYGGGGGYGDPAERDPHAVHADVDAGYLTEAGARRDYPHAFAS